MSLPRQNPVAGIAFMIATGLCFISLDTVGKALTDRLDVIQITWGRFVFSLLIFLAMMPRHGLRPLRSAAPGLQIARGAMLVAVNILYFAGVAVMQLIEATAITQTTPLFLTALAALVLREQVGWRRWAAVLVGFVGAMVVIRPGLGVFRMEAALLLLLAVINAFYLMATRKAAAHDAPETSYVFPALMGAVLNSFIVPFAWRPLAAADWGWLAAMGVLGGLGHLFLVQAYARAPASVLAPFPYLIIVWSGVFGYAAFGDVPDGWTVTGGALIVASGIYIGWRERLRARSGAPAHAPGDDPPRSRT